MLTEEQKAERARVIGGSDVAALFNLEPYWCERKLFFKKTLTELDFPEEEGNKMMERGSRLEHIVAEEYAHQTGQKLRILNKMQILKGKPYCGAHIDRHIVAFEDEDPNSICIGPGVLEIKVVNQFVFKQYLENGLPEAYVMQLQWGMHVLGWQWGAFAIFCPDTGPYLFQLEAFPQAYSPEICQKIEEKADEHWQKVLNGPVPDALEDPYDKRCKECNYHVKCKGSINSQEIKAEAIDAEKAPEMDEAVEAWIEAVDVQKGAKSNLESHVKVIKELLNGRDKVIAGEWLITNKMGNPIARSSDTSIKINAHKIENILSDIHDLVGATASQELLDLIQEGTDLLDLKNFKLDSEPFTTLRRGKIKE